MISKNDIDRMVELAKEYKELYDEIDRFAILNPWGAVTDSAGILLTDEDAVRQQARELGEKVKQDSGYIYFKYKDVCIYCVKREVERHGNQ